MDEGLQQKKINSVQKTGIFFLILFTCLIILFFSITFYNNIHKPFQIKNPVVVDASKNSMSKIERLKHMDTDHDGLSDYDEIYVYHTNPYLADTDSDGIPDKVEIEQGTNPLCPQGRTCTGDAVSVIATTVVSSSHVGRIAPSSGLAVVSSSGLLSNVVTQSTQVGLDSLVNDPKKLRQFLLSSGQVSSDTLNHISDTELVTFAKQELASQLASSTDQ